MNLHTELLLFILNESVGTLNDGKIIEIVILWPTPICKSMKDKIQYVRKQPVAVCKSLKSAVKRKVF